MDTERSPLLEKITGQEPHLLRFEHHLEGGFVRLFRRMVDEAVENGQVILMLDLSAVGHADSAGLGALLSAERRVSEAGGELVLIAPVLAVRKTLFLLGLDLRIKVFPDEDAARAWLGPSPKPFDPRPLPPTAPPL